MKVGNFHDSLWYSGLLSLLSIHYYFHAWNFMTSVAVVALQGAVMLLVSEPLFQPFLPSPFTFYPHGCRAVFACKSQRRSTAQ